MRGHEEASGTKYVPQQLFDEWSKKDPIKNYEEFLLNEFIITEENVKAFREEIKHEIETGLEITVSHYPPGTSKWNKIEHRLFSYISMNWKAKPLLNVQLVIDLIAATTTAKGLKVKSKLVLC